MNSVTVDGNIDDRHLLSAQVPESIPIGPVTIIILPAPSADESEQGWNEAVAREWAHDLADTRQDIYSLDDGKPVDAG